MGVAKNRADLFGRQDLCIGSGLPVPAHAEAIVCAECGKWPVATPNGKVALHTRKHRPVDWKLYPPFVPVPGIGWVTIDYAQVHRWPQQEVPSGS